MDCHFEKQQVSARQLGHCGEFITIPQGFDSISAFFCFPPPKLYKRGHKKTVPVLDNNFLHFLFFHSAENKDACISYEIFAQRFKVLTVIAVDLHFDDSFGLPCGVGFDEYVSMRHISLVCT